MAAVEELKEALLTPGEEEALVRFCEQLRRRWGGRVLQIKLFGSSVRGGRHEDSDIDVFVLLDHESFEDRAAILDLAYDISLPAGVRLSPLVMGRERFDDLRRRERAIAAEVVGGISL